MKTITKNRRYDIDWLRVIAIGLLLVYHIGIGFQPWGVFIQFIQSNKPLHSLWVPMSMLNIWRIPLLFFVSGMGVCFAIRKRNWKQLLLERTQRILVPLIFGIFFIVPIHIFIWQKFYSQDMVYTPHPVHLWFLGNIFIYVVLLSPLFFYLKKNENGRIKEWLTKVFKNPMGMLLIAAALFLEAIWMKPEIYETYALTWHGFFLGMLAFLFGFLGVYSGDALWKTLLKWKWILLFLAVVLFAVRYLVFDLTAPYYFLVLESCSWIFAIFGLGHRYLNRPGKTLSYLSKAAYPVYIIHMIFLYLASYVIMPLEISNTVQFILVVSLTGIGCFGFYDFVIRRVWFLRPLFGLKVEERNRKMFTELKGKSITHNEKLLEKTG
jgi:peptidoglycan/LPS O-acetylase OafA/YrhL